MRLYNNLTQSNSSTARKILQANMQLSSQCDNCWSSHILSAMNGLTQSFMFKERLLNCEPIDLGRLLWTLGIVTWIIAHLIMICIHKSATANALLTINGAPFLQRGPWPQVRHASFPDTCPSIFLVTLFAAWLVSDFMPTPYELKLWPGLTIPRLLVTCAMLTMYKMSSMSFFAAPIHTWSLSAGPTRLFHSQVSAMCLLFLARTTISSLSSFTHYKLFMSRLAVALLDWRPFPRKPLTSWSTGRPCTKQM